MMPVFFSLLSDETLLAPDQKTRSGQRIDRSLLKLEVIQPNLARSLAGSTPNSRTCSILHADFSAFLAFFRVSNARRIVFLRGKKR
jgi:hypothetical protein